MRPVYLHGRGLVSSLGANLPQAVAAIVAGGKAPQRISLAGGTVWPYFGIEYPGADCSGANWRARARQLVRAAMREAGLESCPESCKDAPLFIATSSFDIGAIETGQGQLRGCDRFAEEVAAWLGWKGEIYLVSSACVSSLQAMLAAQRLIGGDHADEAVVLGIELFNRFSLSGFAAMQLLTPGTPTPLGAGRDGIALGEAVAALHLSGRPARWRLCGGSNIVDGRDPTGAIPQTVSRMCDQALASCGLAAADIDLIKLQAAGSPANDQNELAGLAASFDPLPPLVTLKAALGHTLGASGAAEIALLLACLEANIWPHLNYRLDPELRAGLADARPEAVRYLLADILGFGGGHTAVILEDTYGHL